MTQRQSQVKLLSVHEFAEVCQTTPRTIRFYDKKGLLKPKKIDEWTKYRYYSPDQAHDFLQIRLLQNFYVTLRDIPKSLRNKSAKAFLTKRLAEVAQEIEEKQKEYRFLTTITEFLYSQNTHKLIKHETFGPYLLFCVRRNHGRYDQIDNELMLLKKVAHEHKIALTGEKMIFYWNPYEYRPHDSDLEICLVCKPNSDTSPVSIPDEFHFKTFEKQQVWTYTYVGPFEYLTFIHKTMFELTQAKKYESQPFDIHFAGPWDTESKYDFMTKIGYPVKNK
jgi:DNA-binding transcriptional MerR regulator